MKLSLIGACAALTLSFAGATFAADSADAAAATSGASNATVMTQSHDAKAQKKHKNESQKGGRPINQAAKKSAD
ncbi:hypothetical protein [Pseudomonas abieticivorans]|uniref:hypothetical protein n=1 Tax=Pseudomonas abieticivorans TaxID=2931382 RepID=UPI0020BE4B41|nr:hypothetical protein [Pseudomonas sp. PIA16]